MLLRVRAQDRTIRQTIVFLPFDLVRGSRLFHGCPDGILKYHSWPRLGDGPAPACAVLHTQSGVGSIHLCPCRRPADAAGGECCAASPRRHSCIAKGSSWQEERDSRSGRSAPREGPGRCERVPHVQHWPLGGNCPMDDPAGYEVTLTCYLIQSYTEP